MYQISRKNGDVELSIPKNHKDKETLKLSIIFAFLLPINCDPVSGKEFAQIIVGAYDSPQSNAVADAVANC